MVFSTFGIVRMVLGSADFELYSFSANATGVFIHIWIILLFVYFGNSITTEAEKVVDNFGELLRKFLAVASEGKTVKHMYLMSEIRSRKLSIGNDFFKINWNVALTVSVELKKAIIDLSFSIILQILSTIVTYLVITCQFDD